ncbi:hypothetical protein H4R34_002670 [Dimargaris verticillata]|uniref:Glutamine synthetase n=1 Tax=Dimargaris verticillata TaxID=2761393 RepID=A0A9W8B1F0_9FUNG|nr:hypothetical protein H4R34_002670 [Dimargaris verticillata]
MSSARYYACDEAPKTAAELIELLRYDDRVKVAGVDIDGVLRGKVMAKEKFLSAAEEGFGFCSVVFGWDLHDQTYGVHTSISNAENGFGDIMAHIDLSTFRRIPWENNIAFFLLRFKDRDGQPLSACSRSLLTRVVGGYHALNLDPLCGAEFEFYNYQETPQSLAEKQGQGITPMTPGMFGYSILRPTLQREFFDKIFSYTKSIGVPIEGLHTESGPGVYEAALVYAPALEMADRAILFKTTVKQIGLHHGIIPSFMAKPSETLPGCSGHLHFSVRDKSTGINAFYDAQAQPTDADPHRLPGMSDTMAAFMTGLLIGLPSILVILAPNINSYKRLVENYWAPVYVNWGQENRTASVRVILPPAPSSSSATTHPTPSPNGKATRLEMRVSGSDINPHLAIAACLACGLWGIKHKLTRIPIASLVNRIDPSAGQIPTVIDTQLSADAVGAEGLIPVSVQGKVQADAPRGVRLSRSLGDAIKAMQEPQSIARQVLGDEFVYHYTQTRLHECNLWENAITDWELKRYLEVL